ncbi:hypothetical protein M378DRAFT_192729 [Amanita muscaria Koide BX008]|uniref:Protein FRA10AC1 n=1 Tax=Amanita muscaria (strain Koide BX008) TaxID=946122 RepID=A0A0C2TBX4_AMAMK|nr:hypothetical protein M378DRAFT_192729 [Amanita muscaria Koide BX008]
MSLYPSSKVAAPRVGFTEFEILKASHKFLRDENPEDPNNKSWNEQLAKKYYENLYREFAVCDLKHYKSGNFALRWRTEDEVLSGAGETTCANTRCEHHHAITYNMSSSQHAEQSRSKIPLTTLELPFAYEEHGEHKSALVKVVLCDRCVQKLMYKRNKEKKKSIKAERASQADGDDSKGDKGATKEEKQPASRLPAEDEVDDQCHETDGRHRHKHRKRSRSPRHDS